MSLHVIHAGKGFAQAIGERFAEIQADEKGAHQSRTVGRSNAFDFTLLPPCTTERFIHHFHDPSLVSARSKFRDDSPIGGMHPLRGNDV